MLTISLTGFCFETGLLCSFGCSYTRYVDNVGLELPSTGLKTYTTMPSFEFLFFKIRIALHSSGCSRKNCVDQAGLNSATQILGLSCVPIFRGVILSFLIGQFGRTYKEQDFV